jgi:hypothetical protein
MLGKNLANARSIADDFWGQNGMSKKLHQLLEQWRQDFGRKMMSGKNLAKIYEYTCKQIATAMASVKSLANARSMADGFWRQNGMSNEHFGRNMASVKNLANIYYIYLIVVVCVSCMYQMDNTVYV